MKEINKPIQTYFIAYDVDKKDPAFGVVESEQIMTSGRTILFETVSKIEWETKLNLDFGIENIDE